MTSICKTTLEANGTLAVVEGTAAAVNSFVRNCGNGVKRGAMKFATSTDQLITNQSNNVVKVTSYEPVKESTPLGLPTLNFLDDSEKVKHVNGGGTIRSTVDPNEPVDNEPEKPPVFFGAAGATNKRPLGLPDMGFASGQGEVKPPKPAPLPGTQTKRRLPRDSGRQPLGLPKLEFKPEQNKQQQPSAPRGTKPLGLPKLFDT